MTTNLAVPFVVLLCVCCAFATGCRRADTPIRTTGELMALLKASGCKLDDNWQYDPNRRVVSCRGADAIAYIADVSSPNIDLQQLACIVNGAGQVVFFDNGDVYNYTSDLYCPDFDHNGAVELLLHKGSVVDPWTRIVEISASASTLLDVRAPEGTWLTLLIDESGRWFLAYDNVYNHERITLTIVPGRPAPVLMQPAEPVGGSWLRVSGPWVPKSAGPVATEPTTSAASRSALHARE